MHTLCVPVCQDKSLEAKLSLEQSIEDLAVTTGIRVVYAVVAIRHSISLSIHDKLSATHLHMTPVVPALTASWKGLDSQWQCCKRLRGWQQTRDRVRA